MATLDQIAYILLTERLKNLQMDARSQKRNRADSRFMGVCDGLAMAGIGNMEGHCHGQILMVEVNRALTHAGPPRWIEDRDHYPAYLARASAQLLTRIKRVEDN